MSLKVLEGTNGFRFLGGAASNDILPHLTGEMRMTEGALNITRHNAKAIRAIHPTTVTMVVPEAHVVYADLLPDGLTLSDARPVGIAVATMGERAIYLGDHLRRMRESNRTVYTGRDSHWTEAAAFAGYEALRPLLNLPYDFDRSYEPDPGGWEAEDLVHTGEGIVERERSLRRMHSTNFTCVFHTRMINHGAVAMFSNPTGQGRCLAFGTSFSTRLVPAYASDFRELVYCYGTTMDEVVYQLVRPDHVIVEMPERFVHYPSIAVPGSTLASAYLISCQPDFEGIQLDAGDDIPAAMRPLATVVRDICRGGKSVSDYEVVLSRVHARHPAGGRFLSAVIQMSKAVAQPWNLRPMIAGLFMRPGFVNHPFVLVDTGELNNAFAGAMPWSEMGQLIKTRMQIRAGLYGDALDTVTMAESWFGRSDHSRYYCEYITGLLNQGQA